MTYVRVQGEGSDGPDRGWDTRNVGVRNKKG